MTTTENTTAEQLTTAMTAVAEAKRARQANRCWATAAALLKVQKELEDLIPEGCKECAEMYTAVAGTSDATFVENLILASLEEA